jgi:cytochrome c
MKRGIVVGGLVALTMTVAPIMQAQAGAEAKCKVCHSFDTTNKVGPGLAGVYGKKTGSAAGYKYSDALKSGGWVWDDEHLKEYLADSNAAVKKFTGNDAAKSKMPPQKLKGAKLDEVINFLKGLK